MSSSILKIEISNARFVLDIQRGSVFVRLPYIGQAFAGRGLTSWDTWGQLRATGEV